jgi:hypothetical protein
MQPPGNLEVFLFWAVGMVVAILSGAVAILRKSASTLGRALGAGARGRCDRRSS